MMYLWLALPLAVSVGISLLAQMERKRLRREPLPERRLLVDPGGIRGDKLLEQTRRRRDASIVEIGKERLIRRL